ncbi:hypothetical protein QUA00_20945 [Microcoleus sp. T2B6]|uniref:hypothetical protein n=1 Tax=Microcoleus sp. T2B6 TaxID=3055424 RepID=UPI002FCEE203
MARSDSPRLVLQPSAVAFEAADQHPRWRKFAVQLSCLTTRVKARRIKSSTPRIQKLEGSVPKTCTGKSSKYRVKKPVFLEVRSIALHGLLLGARYRR